MSSAKIANSSVPALNHWSSFVCEGGFGHVSWYVPLLCKMHILMSVVTLPWSIEAQTLKFNLCQPVICGLSLELIQRKNSAKILIVINLC